jgi:hypothetical protein
MTKAEEDMSLDDDDIDAETVLAQQRAVIATQLVMLPLETSTDRVEEAVSDDADVKD